MARTTKLEFEGSSGERLSGALDLPDGPARAYAIFAHCFTCTKSSLAAVRISRALTAAGIGILRFDFTGLGQSDGDFSDSSFSGNIADLLAASAAMSAEDRTPSLLLGHSLGGAAVLAAAGGLPDVNAVAVIGAPSDVKHVMHLFRSGIEALLRDGEAEVDIGGRPFRLRRSFVDDLEKHDQAERIRNLRRPLLILHSPIDQIVGIENASAIFDAARHPKSFASLDKADHLLTRAADAEYAAEVVAAWASRHIGNRPPLRSETQCGEIVVEETGEGKFQVEVLAGGARFLADEPPEVGGIGSGPTPYDLLSAGLGACTAMTLRLYARHKNFPLGKVQIVVSHAKGKDAPGDIFTRTISVDGAALSAERSAKILEMANRCPVHRTLTGDVEVITAFMETAEPAETESPIQHALDAELAMEQN